MKKNILKLTQNFMTLFFSKNFMNKNTKSLTPEKISRFFSALMILGIIFTTISCEEDPNNIGAILIPSEDSIGVQYDTLITFDGFLMDTEEFNTKNLDYYTIGNFQDPYFGELIGKYAGQFIPQVEFTNVMYANQFYGATFDSANIVLDIKSLYGNPKGNTELSVYQLTDSIPRAETAEFFSNTDINDYYTASEKINEGSLRMQDDTMLIIPLKESFYSTLETDTLDENNFYFSKDIFLQVFKGLAIIPETPSDIGGLYNFSEVKSYINLYYTDKDDTAREFTYRFHIGERFAQYSFDPKDAEITNYNDPETPSDLLFLQSLGGITSKLVFSNYKTIFESEYAYSIHNAEITVPVFKDESFDICPPPERLFFTDTSFVIIEDVENSTLFNGYYDDENFEYKLNISKYFRDLVNGDVDDPTLVFTINNYNLYPNRVILKAGENIKLRVTYTKH
jgi:Domain of unknown function (DUF4270)